MLREEAVELKGDNGMSYVYIGQEGAARAKALRQKCAGVPENRKVTSEAEQSVRGEL